MPGSSGASSGGPSAGRNQLVALLGRVADHLVAMRPGHPVRVAVDGITAAGKTTFAAQLTTAVDLRGRPAVHLSTDDFHHVATRRHRDPDRARGYYRDAYDLDRFRHVVLDPLGPGGTLRYQPRSHDLVTDRMLDDVEPVAAAADTVVIVDGSFLQSKSLRGGWDEVIWLDTTAEVAVERAVIRDSAAFGGAAATRAAYAQRYHAAGGMYAAEWSPDESATVVIDNNDLDAPVLRRIGGPVGATAALFSYGTLQSRDVQRATFGRELVGVPDALAGYATDSVRITDAEVVATSGSDRHPIVVRSDDPSDVVGGTALTVTTEELAAADRYEVPAYRRARVTLGSGTRAWVYLAAEAVR